MEINSKENNNSKILKTKLFDILKEENEDFEISNIKTEKLKLKHILTSNTYNIESGLGQNKDYRNYDNLNNKLLIEKKNNKNKENSFNLIPPKLQIGDTIPMKFLNLNNKISNLPSNKLNVIILFSRHYIFLLEKMEKFLRTLQKSNFISTLNISLDNYIKEGLLEYTEEFLLFKRLFQIESLPYAIVYDNKFKIIWKGLLNELLEEKMLREVFEFNNVVNVDKSNKQGDNIIKNNEKVNVDNLIELNSENNEQYLQLKDKLKGFNKKNLKAKKCKLKNCEIRMSRLKRYIITSSNNSKSKFIYKPILDYNESATVTDNTGTYLDDLMLNNKPLLNFKAHQQEEDYRKYVKFAVDYVTYQISIPLSIESKLKLGLRCEELLGIGRRKTKYHVYNKTPCSDLFDIGTYFNFVAPTLGNFVLSGSNMELKEAVDIKLSYYSECNRKFVVPYLDESKVEMALEGKVGEINIIYIFTNYMPVFLQMFTANIPAIENIKRVHNCTTKINSKIAICCSIEDIDLIKFSPEFLEAKAFAKENCEFIFIDFATQANNWMQYFSLNEVGALIIDKKGTIFFFNFESAIYIDNKLKEILSETKNYPVDKTTYDELKEYGKKLLGVKIPNLEYNPCLNINFNTKSDIENGSLTDFDTKDVSYDVSFTLTIRRKDQNCLITYINGIKKILKIKDEEELRMNEELIDCNDIEHGKECFECKKDIIQSDAHYYCYWCKIHFCFDCGNKYNETEADIIKKLPHEHYLTYIKVKNGSGMKNIDSYKFGNNIWKMYYYPENIRNTYECSGCVENFVKGGKRYICLTCRPGPVSGMESDHKNGYVDFCESCFDLISSGKWQENINFKKQIEKESHDCDTHIYLRIDYQTGNYFIF